MFKGSRKIKGFDYWVVVRCMKPDDFGVTRGRLWKKIRVRSDQVPKLHFGLIGVPARTQHMSFQVNRRGVVRSNWKYMNFVSILHRKAAQFGANRIRIAGFSNLDAQHRALLMRN